MKFPSICSCSELAPPIYTIIFFPLYRGVVTISPQRFVFIEKILDPDHTIYYHMPSKAPPRSRTRSPSRTRSHSSRSASQIMQRHAQYIDLIGDVHSRLPDEWISGDILLGGEQAKAVSDIVELFEEIPNDKLQFPLLLKDNRRQAKAALEKRIQTLRGHIAILRF